MQVQGIYREPYSDDLQIHIQPPATHFESLLNMIKRRSILVSLKTLSERRDNGDFGCSIEVKNK